MKTLFWKEFRENRLLLFLSFGLIMAVFILQMIFKETWFDFEIAAGTAYVLFVILALMLGISSFSSESDEEKMEFILSMPVGKNRIFWTKFLAGLANLLLIFAFTFIVTRIFSTVSYQGKAYAEEFLLSKNILLGSAILFSIALYLYSAGFLLSSLRVRALQSFISAFLLAVFLYIATNPLSNILFGCSSFFSDLLGFYARAFILHILLCAAISVFSACYFWKFHVTRGIPYFKKVMKTVFLFILFLGALYAGLNLFYTCRLNKEILRMKASGRPTTLVEAAPVPIPDEKNAAFIYQKAFKLFKDREEIEWSNAFKNLDLSNFSLWKAEDKKRISRIAAENEPAYLLIREAAILTECRFPLDYAAYYGWKTSHLDFMKMLRNILIARMITDFEKKDITTILEDVSAGIRMAEHLSKEPLTNYSMFHTGTIYMFLQILQQLYDRRDLNLSQLKKTAESLDNISGCENKVKVLEGERALFIMDYFHRIIYPRTNEIYVPFFKNKLIRFLYLTFFNFAYKADCILFLQISEKQLNLLCEPYYKTKDAFEKYDANSNTLARHPLTAMLSPSYGMQSVSIARFEATRDLAKIATALKMYRLAHGRYPEILAELKPDFIPELPLDPFTGKDFIYQKKDKGFIVYSVGQDLKDNGGVTAKETRTGYYDIVWENSK